MVLGAPAAVALADKPSDQSPGQPGLSAGHSVAPFKGGTAPGHGGTAPGQNEGEGGPPV
jgi:hypothetical protein